MNTKIISLTIYIMISLMCLSLVSCGDDDEPIPAKPIVELKELGSGHDNPNDNVAYIGSHLHISCEILAEGTINGIEVIIKQKEGDYSINRKYSDEKYAGKKNAHFHEHIDIPSDAIVGEYTFSLLVTDKSGQTTKADSSLRIEEGHTHD